MIATHVWPSGKAAPASLAGGAGLGAWAGGFYGRIEGGEGGRVVQVRGLTPPRGPAHLPGVDEQAKEGREEDRQQH